MQRFFVVFLGLIISLSAFAQAIEKNEMHEAYMACKARTGGQSLMYSYCYSHQDALTNCDCVSDTQAPSVVTFRASQSQVDPYTAYTNGLSVDESIINSYITYLTVYLPADEQKRMIEAWSKVSLEGAGIYPIQQPYSQYNPCPGHAYYDSKTQMCWN